MTLGKIAVVIDGSALPLPPGSLAVASLCCKRWKKLLSCGLRTHCCRSERLRCPALILASTSRVTNRVRRRIVWYYKWHQCCHYGAAADEGFRFLRWQRAAQYLSARKKDCILVPAGLRGRYSLEDTWCAGYIARQLEGCAVSDSAQTAMCIAEHWSLRDLSAAQHGQVLLGLGMAADVEYCLALNASPNVIRQDPLSGWCTLA